MSRIGRKPIMLTQAVDVQIQGNTVIVKGPKGQLARDLHADMIIRREDNHILIERPSNDKKHCSLHGLTRTLLNNMVLGVTSGFEKTLELVGVGYRASKQGNKLVLAMGYSHPVEIVPEDGLEIDVLTPTRIVVKGVDKEKVGNLAARIRSVREPEPYKGKGIRYAGEKIRRKAGKTGGKGKK